MFICQKKYTGPATKNIRHQQQNHSPKAYSFRETDSEHEVGVEQSDVDVDTEVEECDSRICFQIQCFSQILVFQ